MCVFLVLLCGGFLIFIFFYFFILFFSYLFLNAKPISVLESRYIIGVIHNRLYGVTNKTIVVNVRNFDATNVQCFY